MATLSIQNVVKAYGAHRVIHGLSFDIVDGEFIVFVGPSGCGKSTLLRMIAGLENFQEGSISIDGTVVNRLRPWERDVAMVFQEYALYPHMTVEKNIGFALRMNGVPEAQVKQRVEDVSRTLRLTHLLKRRPRELSGGQRQRVAMGRAMVRGPKVFLFDEPLSNLDAQLRVDLRAEIKQLHQRLGSTMIYVTHDQVEAMTMADRIVVLKDGHIQQIGAPQELYRNPRTRFVAGFIGAPAMNFLPVQLSKGVATLPDGTRIPVSVERRDYEGAAELGVRPEHLSLDSAHRASSSATISGPVQLIEPLGADTLALLDIAGNRLNCRLPGDMAPAPGEILTVSFDPDRCVLFDQAGARI
ncbi:ABC transporter ATP-binding protein [Agrobacterium sp. P15N1-A]|uniref:ABC transporter ATP-binding protein n=1 Tax=Agrobacterium sp. P15N1-A TaxID=3342820 RepID=UPI0037CE7992